ncbi:MAG: hypothetical protein CHACPFDD_03015 [Phycisphaerae bacterium]|nr:hypothetical protein [Phycisphaerae bacterium]
MSDMAAPGDRRHATRSDSHGEMWLISHEAGTVLRCRCDNASERGLHLIAPLGYGIAEGQQYELRAIHPGVMPIPGYQSVCGPLGTIVHTEVIEDAHESRLGVGVAFTVGQA